MTRLVLMPMSPAASAVVRGRHDSLAEDRAAVEELDQQHEAMAPKTTSTSIGRDVTPPRLSGASAAARGTAGRRGPDILGEVAEDDAERDRRHDPAGVALGLDRLADAETLDHGALQQPKARTIGSISQKPVKATKVGRRGPPASTLALAEFSGIASRR